MEQQEQPTWEEAIDAFIARKRCTVKERSVVWYEQRMRALFRYVDSRKPFVPLEKWAPRHMDTYGVHRLEVDGISKSTWRADVVAVRELFEYVAEEWAWRSSPLARYPLPRAPKPDIKVPTDDDLRMLLRAIEDRQSTRNPKMRCRPAKEVRRLKLRDAALLRLMLTTGARIGECLALDMRDVDHKALEVIFRDTKGNEPRVVGIEKAASDSVDAWLAERESIARKKDRHGYPLVETERLFITAQGQPLDLRAAERRYELYRAFAGLSGWTCHGIRHWSVTTIIDRSDIQTAQIVVGHKNIATTQGYDHRTKDRAKERHKAAKLLGGLEESGGRRTGRSVMK